MDRGGTGTPAQNSRSQTQFCCAPSPWLVSGGRRRRPQAARPLYVPRACPRQRHLLVSDRRSRADGDRRRALRQHRRRRAVTPATPGFPTLLQEFFQRLVTERGVSAHTIASYRDTFQLLLGYAQERTGRTPSALTLEDLDTSLVLAFLDHLENVRGNSPRTRNLRLTAIRSFMRHASLRAPTALPVAQRVLAISPKRFDKPALGYLTREEVTALLDAPDPNSWSGRRDAVLLAVLYNTGARVSELAGLRISD